MRTPSLFSILSIVLPNRRTVKNGLRGSAFLLCCLQVFFNLGR